MASGEDNGNGKNGNGNGAMNCNGNEIPHKTIQGEICITFANPLNSSVQIGDRIYFATPSTGQAGTNHPSSPVLTKPVYLGIATSVYYWNEDDGESMICIEEPLTSTVDTTGCTETGDGTPVILNPNQDSNVQVEGTCCDVFYFFSKDNEVNLTSLIGYYAEVEIRNNSLTEAEIFSITSDFESSSR